MSKRSFVTTLLALTLGCGPAPTAVPSRDAAPPIDCGRPEVTNSFTISPLQSVGLTPGRMDTLNLYIYGQIGPIVRVTAQVYFSQDGVAWRRYSAPVHLDWRDTAPLQARFLGCLASQEEEIYALNVNVEVPVLTTARFAIVGVAESLYKNDLRIGGRGQVGETIPCAIRPRIECGRDRACQQGPVSFQPTDEPGTQICAQLIR